MMTEPNKQYNIDTPYEEALAPYVPTITHGLWWAQRFGLLQTDAGPDDLRTQLTLSIIAEATRSTEKT